MRTIKGGVADRNGKTYSINVDTATSAPLTEEDFNKIINNPRLTRVLGFAEWKNKKEIKRGK